MSNKNIKDEMASLINLGERILYTVVYKEERHEISDGAKAGL